MEVKVNGIKWKKFRAKIKNLGTKILYKKIFASVNVQERVITFNTDLLMADDQFISEVIIHELLHLKGPQYHNHGKLFKTMLNYWITQLIKS